MVRPSTPLFYMPGRYCRSVARHPGLTAGQGRAGRQAGRAVSAGRRAVQFQGLNQALHFACRRVMPCRAASTTACLAAGAPILRPCLPCPSRHWGAHPRLPPHAVDEASDQLPPACLQTPGPSRCSGNRPVGSSAERVQHAHCTLRHARCSAEDRRGEGGRGWGGGGVGVGWTCMRPTTLW